MKCDLFLPVLFCVSFFSFYDHYISFLIRKKFHEKILLNTKKSMNANFKTTRNKNLSSEP